MHASNWNKKPLKLKNKSNLINAVEDKFVMSIK